MSAHLSGDAVVSFRALKRASEVASGDPSLRSILSLFSLIEAVVLYERLWYQPSGEIGVGFASNFEIWDPLCSAGLIKSLDGNLNWKNKLFMERSRESWGSLIGQVCRIPQYNSLTEAELLDNEFEKAYEFPMYLECAMDDGMPFGPEGLTTKDIQDWKRYVTGVGFDRKSENAEGDEADSRELHWSMVAKCLARASIAETLGGDYVTDPFEGAALQAVSSVSRRNQAARLYESMSHKFENELRKLIDDGLGVAIPIPPAAAIVLERSDGSLKSIVREAAALREEFKKFRVSYKAYMDLLENPVGKTLADMAKLKKEMVDEVLCAINSISVQGFDSRVLTEIFSATISSKSKNDNQELEVESCFSIGALMSLGVKHYRISKIKGRARILFDSYYKAMNVANYHSLLGKKLNAKIEKREILGYQNFVQAIEAGSHIIRS